MPSQICPHGHVSAECFRCTPVLRSPWSRSAKRRRVAPVLEDPLVQYIRRVVGAEVRGPSGGAPEPGLLRTSAPAILEFLTIAAWEDGTVRQVGTIMVLVDGLVWKAWVHDRDGRRSCFVSSRTPEDLLAAVEEVLANGGGEWRSDDRPNKAKK